MTNLPQHSYRALACETCGFFSCVCAARARHRADCKFMKTLNLHYAISCDHGHDVCAQCDPCTCGAGILESEL